MLGIQDFLKWDIICPLMSEMTKCQKNGSKAWRGKIWQNRDSEKFGGIKAKWREIDILSFLTFTGEARYKKGLYSG